MSNEFTPTTKAFNRWLERVKAEAALEAKTAEVRGMTVDLAVAKDQARREGFVPIIDYDNRERQWRAYEGNLKTRADRAEAALERVKALHEKKESEALTGECADETCEHEDTCPTQPFEVCIACWDLCEESDPYFGERGISQVLYPCPTIRALETGADQ